MLWAGDVHAAPEAGNACVAPKILVIDDDQVDCLHSKRLLTEIIGSKLGLDFSTTWDEAVQAVAADCHDVYLVDYLPGPGTGLEVVEAYSSDVLFAHRRSMARSIPALYLKGQGEYFDALRENLVRADEGAIDAKEALARTATQ